MFAVRSGASVCAKLGYTGPNAVDPVTTGVSNIRTQNRRHWGYPWQTLLK